jgi:hypothetical protein
MTQEQLTNEIAQIWLRLGLKQSDSTIELKDEENGFSFSEYLKSRRFLCNPRRVEAQ